jgi:hypothetical protein
VLPARSVLLSDQFGKVLDDVAVAEDVDGHVVGASGQMRVELFADDLGGAMGDQGID